MTGEGTTGGPRAEQSGDSALRERMERLERDLSDRTARANAAVAEAQDRSYWLDRWRLDLNELMRRRGAAELRAAFRAVRGVYRFVHDARGRLDGLPHRLGLGRAELERERDARCGREPERFARTLSPSRCAPRPVTDALLARLDEDDLEAIEARLEPDEAAIRAAADEGGRRRLTLAFAAHHAVQPALGRTGLRADMPPPDVHSMARGPTAAGGSTYYADLVVDALARCGGEPGGGETWLDFGCSSGRVVRVLAAGCRTWIGTAAIRCPERSSGRASTSRRFASSTAPSTRRCHTPTAPSTAWSRSPSGATSPKARACAGSRRCAGS